MLKATSDQPILELLVRSTIRCQLLDETIKDKIGLKSNDTGVCQYAILRPAAPINDKNGKLTLVLVPVLDICEVVDSVINKLAYCESLWAREEVLPSIVVVLKD